MSRFRFIDCSGPTRLLIVALLCGFFLAGCNLSFSSGERSNLPTPTSGSAEEQKAAEKAAREYLLMIDRGEYDKTWDSSGSALRAQTNKFAWTNTLRLARKAFSVSSTREIEGFGFSTRIDESVPVGEYVLVQFKGVSGNVTTTEKVVMQKENSTWKIIGYFVNKRADYKIGG